jgi:hypothetical protein
MATILITMSTLSTVTPARTFRVDEGAGQGDGAADGPGRQDECQSPDVARHHGRVHEDPRRHDPADDHGGVEEFQAAGEMPSVKRYFTRFRNPPGL